MRTIRSRLLAAALGAALSACGDAPLLGGGAREGRMTLDLTPLYTTPAGRMVIPGTVIDSLHLEVRPGGATTPLVFGTTLRRGDTQVSFPVTVPEGRTLFEARVLSTNRTVLYSGQTTQEIAGDGFSVSLVPQPRAPVLVVAPDTLRLGVLAVDSTLVITNRGIGTLAWRVAKVSNPSVPCEGSGCMGMQPTSGQLPARASARLLLFPGRLAPPEPYVIVLSSAEGEVELRVRVVR